AGASLAPLPGLPGSERDSTAFLVRGRAGGRAALALATIGRSSTSGDAHTAVRPIAFPTETADYLDGDPREGGTLLFADTTPQGMFLWATDALGEHPAKRLALNEHAARIGEGRR